MKVINGKKETGKELLLTAPKKIYLYKCFYYNLIFVSIIIKLL